MKKKLLISTLVISVFTLGGCFKSEDKVTLDFKKIEEKISSLNDGKFSLTMVNTDEMEEFSGNLNYIYDFEYEEKIGLNSDSVNIENTNIKYNENTKELLAIIDSIDDEDVNKSMKKFCENLNCKIEEFNEYVIYVSSSSNDEVIKKVKNSKTPIFTDMMAVDGELLESTTGIKESLLDEYLMRVPMMMTQSSSYIILKAKEENKEEVMDLMDKYMASLESTWEMYLPDQYELVKNRLEKEYGEYLIYVISNNNNFVYENITSSNKDNSK